MHEDFTPAEGRSVVYQLAAGEYRPAQIVKVWMDTGARTCNLVVFVDGSNDLHHLSTDYVTGLGVAANPVIWRTSVMLGEGVGEYLPRKPGGGA
jgi:hypothetical protein